jgi:hypothetical protein
MFYNYSRRNFMKRGIFLLILALLLATALVSAVTAQEDGQEYIVQADDWLSKLADKNYGDVLAWPIIWEATNAKSAEDDSFAFIENPNIIEIGQKLWIPTSDAAQQMLTERESKADVDIKIGFMGPLTGGAAFLGTEQLNFAKVATQIFNEETGFNVQIVEGDTMIDPDEAKIVAERLIADDSILAVVGPAGSQVCEAVQPLFQEANLTAGAFLPHHYKGHAGRLGGGRQVQEQGLAGAQCHHDGRARQIFLVVREGRVSFRSPLEGA